MSLSEDEDALYRGQALINLRHGIRQSARLAEHLTGDAIVGNEALGLLGRLRAITAELDLLAFSLGELRRAHNDPFWNEPPHPFQQGCSVSQP